MDRPRGKDALPIDKAMFQKFHPPTGARPGTLVIPTDASPTRIRYTLYSPERVTGGTANNADELPAPRDAHQRLWIDLQGFGNTTLIGEIARRFGIHPLALEDLVNVPQVPKADQYGDQQLVVVKTAEPGKEGTLEMSQLGVLLAGNVLISFQPQPGSLLDSAYERLQLPQARVRNQGIDYLAYVLLDIAVDTCYPVIAQLVESVDQLESRTLENPAPELLQAINAMKNQLSNLRRGLWPQREVLQSLVRGDSPLISEPVRIFLRDTADHCTQATDVIEMYRDRASGLLNMYLSAVAHRSNEIMKILTVVSSIFVPLTFVAGIYGMNFPQMPEFSVPFAYTVFWIVILVMAGAMVGFFLKLGWISVTIPGRKSASSPAFRQQPQHSMTHFFHHTGDDAPPVGSLNEKDAA